MTKQDAKIMVDYYSALIAELTRAKLTLLQGGVKSYTVGDRSLTRFDLQQLGKELDDAVKKKAEYEAILNGKSARKAFGVIING